MKYSSICAKTTEQMLELHRYRLPPRVIEHSGVYSGKSACIVSSKDLKFYRKLAKSICHGLGQNTDFRNFFAFISSCLTFFQDGTTAEFAANNRALLDHE